jgi:DNA-directed RNA polymerase specialized sigma24 family protein
LVLNIIDMGMAGHLVRLGKQVDQGRMRETLKSVAAIQSSEISRRERERLLVRKAISFLPSNCRLVLYLKYWESLTLDEIAFTTGLLLWEVRQLYVASLGYLERELRPYLTEVDFFLRRGVTVG